VGIPVALGAAAIGLGIMKLEKMGEEAIETRHKIDQLSSIPSDILDTGELESNLNEIQEMIDKIAPRQGESYGQQVAENISVGWKAGIQDFLSHAYSDFLDPLTFLMGGLPGPELPTYEKQNLLEPLREKDSDQFHDTQVSDIRSNTPAFQREKIASMEANTNMNTPQGKFDVLEQKNTFAYANWNYDTNLQNKIQKQIDSLNEETAGRELNADEIKQRNQLEKMITRARRQVLDDVTTEHETFKAVNDAIKENARFHPDSVIASHSRRVGGGGRVYSAPHPALHGSADFSVGGGNSTSGAGGRGAGMPTLDSTGVYRGLGMFGDRNDGRKHYGLDNIGGAGTPTLDSTGVYQGLGMFGDRNDGRKHYGLDAGRGEQNHVAAQLDATVKATDNLNNFSNALKEGEAAIRAATGGSLSSSISTPTF
jgi:hypothetical protein